MGKSKKVKSIKEIRKEIGLQMQDRRNYLNALLNVENMELSVKLQEKHINQIEAQLKSGQIEERDNFGNILTKNQLERRIPVRKQELKDMLLKAKYSKEDLYFGLHSGGGFIDKAGNVEKLNQKVKVHFLMIEEEYEKFKER